jgi:pimeloyl-ACP methyl ester carboxylesterase
MKKVFSYQNANITYRTEGKGKPVVLLHGFGEDSCIWNKQIAFLKEHYLLIIPDLPGSGESSLLRLESKVLSFELTEKETQNPKSKTQNDISIEDYADCIYALLKHENIETCTMLGHSMGGYITLAFAKKYPEQLTAFGLVHSTAYADNDEKKKNRERGIALIEEYGAHAFLKTTIPNLFGKAFKESHPEKVTELILAAQAFSKEALQQYTRAMMNRPDMTDVLKSNRLPVLFVIGTEDVAAPMKDMLEQTKLTPHPYIHVLQTIGHMGMWEATNEMNECLLAFINKT